ncbi:uncharacterized protein LOC144355685 [Saccoglossus kowalevskii]
MNQTEPAPPSYDQYYSQQQYYNQAYPAQTYSTPSTFSTAVAPQPVVIRYALIGLDIIGMIMAVWNTFCCFVPLGIPAIIVSAFAFEYRHNGQHDKATKFSKISIGLSIVGFILAVVTIIIVVVVLFVVNTSKEF